MYRYLRPTMKLLVLLITLKILLISNIECKNRVTYYVSLGDRVRLQCLSGGGQYFCFSTYTFQNITHQMVTINSSMKYQVEVGALTINNIEATDAGYYACSSNCNQMKADLIDYYVAPMSGQQPIDVSQNFLAIPPYVAYDSMYPETDNYIVPIRPPTFGLYNRGRTLNDGEIAGIVIGAVVFLLILAVLVTILFVYRKRRAPSGSNSGGKGQRNLPQEESTVDYSTIDSKHDTLKSDKTLITDRDGGNAATRSPARNRNARANDDNELPNIDLAPPSQRSNRSNSQDPDYQTRKNYELANKIASQFTYEEEQRQQQQQQPPPKQLTARYDSYNNSFSAGLDAPQGQNANLYSVSAGMKSPRYKQQQSEELANEAPKRLPPQNRNRIEFPKSPQQQQQQQPQEYDQGQNRKFSNRSHELSENVSDSRNESDEDYARRGGNAGGVYGTKNPERYFDVSDEDRKLSRQTSDEAQQASISSQQNPPPSFKSLLKQQKQQQQRGVNDVLPAVAAQHQPVPTSRSYQGSTQYQQQMQLPRPGYDKRSDSTHERGGAAVRDNTTDV